MPSLKKLSAQLVAFLTVVVLAFGFNVSPAAADAEGTIINGVIYTMDGAGAAYVAGYDESLPTEVSIESSVTIGGNSYAVTTIGPRSFASSGLVSVTIPDSVTSISYEVFSGNSSLVSVIIGKSVTSIDDSAFIYDSALSSVSFHGAAPSLGAHVFYNANPMVYYYKRFGSAVVAGGFTSTWEDLTTVAVDEPFTLTPTPTIGGTATIGQTLTAVAGTWDSGVDLSYQWNRNGDAISGATSATYTLLAADANTSTTVTVTGSKTYFATTSMTSDATNVPPAVTSRTINGVVYTLDGAGAAYVSDSKRRSLPTTLSIESSVTMDGTSYAVTSIGDDTLSYARSLLSLTIPDSVKSIGADAFAHNSALVSLTLGSSLESIGTSAFAYNTSLASVTIPNSVTSIGERAFFADYALESLTLGNSLASIGVSAFSENTSLVSVTIPNSVTSIGERAFFADYALESLTLGSSLETIGGSAFSDNTSLVSVTIPNSVTSIGDYAFFGDSALVSLALGSSLQYIGGSSFAYNTSLVSVTIPDSVTTIGIYAFYGNSSLTSVRFRGAAPFVGDYAFELDTATVYYYPRFASDVVTDGYTSPTWQGLTSVAVDDALTLTLTPTPTVSGNAIVDQTLTATSGDWDAGVELSYQWKRAGVTIDGATSSTYVLTGDDFGAAITVSVTGSKVGYTTVSKTSSATAAVVSQRVTIHGVVYTLDGNGEAYVSDQTNDLPATVVIASSVTIGGQSFAVTSIGVRAMQFAWGMVSLTIPDSVKSIGEQAFLSDENLVSLTLGSSLETIGNAAFSYNKSLVSVTIPDSVKTIGAFAFRGNYALLSVTLGSSLETIGYAAFARDSSLTSVRFRGAAPTVDSYAFDQDSATIYYYSRFGSEAVAGGYTSPTWQDLTAVAVDEALTLTPTPTISGSATVGQTLNAIAGAWDSGVSLSYQWKRGGVAIDGATSATYVLTADDLGAVITVAVTGTKTYFQTTAKTSSATSAVAAGALTLTPTPTISGSATVGQTLTATAGAWDSGVSLSYQWKRGGVAIDGATSATYVLTADDLGAVITVSVTGTKAGYATVGKVSAATSAVAAGALTLTPTPTISGSATVGQTLTAVTGTWDSGVSLAYVWKRNGTAISGAASASYVLTADDLGAVITVSVTGTKAGYTTVGKVSAATSAVAAGALTLTPTPTISGSATVGQTLTATAGSWDSGVSLAYVWKRNGSAISGAASATYVLTADDLGAVITVSVTGTKAGYTTVGKVSAATSAVVAATMVLTPTPTISGSPYVGQVLTAVTGTWDSGVTFAYVWKRNGVAITGATSSGYTLVTADSGKTITLTVTGSKVGVPSVAKTSLATPAITVVKKLQAASKPNILGDMVVGKTLTANLNQWDSGVTFSYQWNRNGVAIAGATAKSYVLTVADLGQIISVTVTGSKAGFISASKTSSNSSAVRAAAFANSPTPRITGVAKIGQLLTANAGTWDAGVTLSYQWKRWGTAIVGATNSTYTPVAADRGAALSVTVVATKAGFATATRTSGSTNAVENR